MFVCHFIFRISLFYIFHNILTICPQFFSCVILHLSHEHNCGNLLWYSASVMYSFRLGRLVSGATFADSEILGRSISLYNKRLKIMKGYMLACEECAKYIFFLVRCWENFVKYVCHNLSIKPCFLLFLCVCVGVGVCRIWHRGCLWNQSKQQHNFFTCSSWIPYYRVCVVWTDVCLGTVMSVLLTLKRVCGFISCKQLSAMNHIILHAVMNFTTKLRCLAHTHALSVPLYLAISIFHSMSFAYLSTHIYTHTQG